MKKKRMLWLSAAALLCLVLSFGLWYLYNVEKYKDTVNQMTFDAIDVTNISDGDYTGECDVDFIYAKVIVTIKNGRIQSIELVEHKNDRGSAAEGITSRIVEAQSLEVDAVSGATNSSKVIKKAVENAIASAANT